MKQWKIRILSILLCLTLLTTAVWAEETVGQTREGLSALGGAPGDLLGQGEAFPAGTSTCDWVAMALALSGSEEDFSSYLNALRDYVENCYASQGGLDTVKSTPWHRIALTVLALGGDPTSFGKHPDGTPIDLIADGTYAFAGVSIGAQGLNGWIYSLIALNASGVTVPDGAKFTREDMVQAILAAQEPDGGFGLTDGRSDVDITAMALQALAPVQSSCAAEIEGALDYLAGAMDENCRYSAYGSQSVESSAQVILALCALGIDPARDSRFQRDSGNLLTGLEVFRQADGTYGHTPEDTEGNYLATAQTLLALTALKRLRSGEGWIFDFTHYAGPRQKESSWLCLTATAVALAAAAVCVVIIIRKRKRHGEHH